jgi:hypothetical protein
VITERVDSTPFQFVALRAGVDYSWGEVSLSNQEVEIMRPVTCNGWLLALAVLAPAMATAKQPSPSVSLEAALQEYLRERTLTRSLGADDLAAWKAAGVPDSVVRVAMTLRVR